MGIGYVEILMALAKEDKTILDFFRNLETFEKLLKQIEKIHSNIVLSTVYSSKGFKYDNVCILDFFDGISLGISSSDYE